MCSLLLAGARSGGLMRVGCSGVEHIEQLKEYSTTIPAVNQIEVGAACS